MKVIVFGASGQCGRHFVQQAAERGHLVTAVVRTDTPFETPPGVTVVRGDALDAAFVREVVPGHDAVLSGLGIRYKNPVAAIESPLDLTARATANMIAAMTEGGVRRISVISAGGVGDSRTVLNERMVQMIATNNVGKAYADLERMEAALRESALNWQAVRPTRLTDEAKTGRAHLAANFPTEASIPRADVAAFMLRELESPKYSAQTPLITVKD